MMRLPSGLAVVLLTATMAAHAEVRPLFASGLWSAYGGQADDQRPVCGIATNGAEGRRVAIEQSAGETGLEILLEKPSWAIPDNTPIEVMLQIDGNAALPIRATGSATRVMIRMPFENSVPFMRGLRHGQQIRVYFPNGNETVWTGGLRGSSAVIDAFNDCRANLMPAVPTQPFRGESGPGPSAPTQPFGTPAPQGLRL